MKHIKVKRESRSVTYFALVFALVACVLIAGGAWWQIGRVNSLSKEGTPDALFEDLRARGGSTRQALEDQMTWLLGVAERMTAQPDAEARRVLLPEIQKERLSLRLGLFDANGEGAFENGETASIAGTEILANALNSPEMRALDFTRLPAISEGNALYSAVSFVDASGDTGVLLAAQQPETLSFTIAPAAFEAFLVTQRGDLIARFDADQQLLPDFANLLDYLSDPAIEGTPAGALYQAFLDGDRGIASYAVGEQWLSLSYQQMEGTNWMLVSASASTGIRAADFSGAIMLVALIAAGVSVLCIAGLGYCVIRTSGRRSEIAQQLIESVEGFDEPDDEDSGQVSL